MRKRGVWALMAAAILTGLCAYSDDVLKIKNASEAMHASVSYLREQNSSHAPGTGVQWQEKTIFSGGPGDLVTTSRQFTSDGWIIEVYQELAPLRNIVYQVTAFSSASGWHWKGSVKADGSIKEESAFKQLSDEERQKVAEELLRKSRIPPPVGGYGH
jgi:hypothetical protein